MLYLSGAFRVYSDLKQVDALVSGISTLLSLWRLERPRISGRKLNGAHGILL